MFTIHLYLNGVPVNTIVGTDIVMSVTGTRLVTLLDNILA